MEKLCWGKRFSHTAFCLISVLIRLSLSAHLKITGIQICFGGISWNTKITGFELESNPKKEEFFYNLQTLQHVHIHHSCWIHKGNKPIEKYTCPDLQLQLGPEGEMDELFNLASCLWYANTVGVDTRKVAGQCPSSLLWGGGAQSSVAQRGKPC